MNFMRISRHNKLLLFEQEFTSLAFIVILSLVFYWFKSNLLFYLIALLAGFLIYFWMLYEEKIHKKGRKHAYFEHTSSYVLLGQTSLVLGLLFLYFNVRFLIIIFFVISVIMYSIALSRIVLYKVVFKK